MSISELTFARMPGDHATYAFGAAEEAVRLARTAGTIAVDIETAGLGADQWAVKAVALGTTSRAIVLDPDNPMHKVAIRTALAEATTILMHNSPFDAPIMVVMGLMRAADVAKVEDTLVSARLAYPGERVSKSLGAASERYLGRGYGVLKSSLEQGFKEATGLSKAAMFKRLGLGSPAYVAYAAFDIIMTARLGEALPAAVTHRLTTHPWKDLRNDPARLIHREQTVNRMLLARSCKGIEIDFDVVDELKGDMARVVAESDKVLWDHGVNTFLTRDLMKNDAVRCLSELGALPANHPRLKNGRPSADKRYLSRIEHPIVAALTARSEADRFSTDYADKLVHLSRDGIMHPQVGVLVATTGRMSYSEPPLQQFPGSVRRMMKFDAPSTSLDWASIEPVIMANAAHEYDLLDGFEAGGDLYMPVAAAAGVTRKQAKVVLLAQLYGQGVAALAGSLGTDEDGARDIVNAVMGKMPRVRKMIRQIKSVGEAVGLVPTMSGRIIPLDPDPKTGNQRFFGYKGVNYYCQGSALDILSEVMYEMHAQGLDDALQAAVHDELVVDTAAADQVQRIMETPPQALIEMAGRTPKLRVGRVSLGTHWNAKEN